MRRKYGRPVVYAVRGELSRDILLQADIDCPKCFGDSALLMPLLYCHSLRISKTVRLGINMSIIMLDGKEEIRSQWFDSISNMATVPSFSIDGPKLLLSFPFLHNRA